MPYSRPTWRAYAPAFIFILVVTHWIHPPFAIAQETMLYSFSGTTGMSPGGGVIRDKEGNLYGTAASGGSSNAGVIFELARNSDGTWTESTLYEFGGAPDGAYPGAPLVFDSNGNLFGTTASGGMGSCSLGSLGCGNVFKLIRNSTGRGWTEQVIYNFSGGSDGVVPASKLVFDGQGNLYGTTFQGGMSSACIPDYGYPGCGTVFELSPNTDGSWSESIVYRFQGGLDGMFPSAVTPDGSTDLVGVSQGGLSCNEYVSDLGCGTIFRLHRTSSGWVKSTPYRFKGGMAGFSPEGRLAVDASGAVYGTTQNGGVETTPEGYGTVFLLTPLPAGSWTGSVLYRFTGLLDGCYPTEGVTLDSAGNVYGEAIGCGSSTAGSDPGGTVFKLTPSSGAWIETTLASFQDQATGQQPLGGVTLDSKGNLYGTLSIGGTDTDTCPIGCGTVFEVAP